MIKAVIKFIGVVMVILSYYCLILIYLTYTIAIDPFMFPTFIMIGIYLIPILKLLFKRNKNEYNLENNKERKKLYKKLKQNNKTFKSLVSNTMQLFYFIYILLLLL
jgi:hypothetical protein